MWVSAGLQKFFDGRRKKKSEIKAKLDRIEDQVDPKFKQSFVDFRVKILWIVEDSPNYDNIVSGELDRLDTSLERVARQHSLKKASSIINSI